MKNRCVYIDKETWPRKAHADFFARVDIPLYSLTFSLDVSAVYSFSKRERLPFYYVMIYLSTRAVNAVQAFRYKLREDGVVLWDVLSPSFTFMYNEAADLFGIANMDSIPNEGLHAFCERAAAVQAATRSPLPTQTEDARDDLIYFSSLPWFSYVDLSQELSFDKNDSIPRLMWGKFEEKDGRKILPYTVQVNHRLVDGVHIYRLKQALEAEIAALAAN